ncbi:MAG TPA: primosomal protein N' [Candidatus Paceibacterota bacterium]|nr:primosomal protein N' [Candidatus Paceibacterota bacterium]
MPENLAKKVYVVEAIPLAVLPPNTPQILSYYHDEKLPKGALVTIPLHRRSVSAVVVGSEELTNRKLLLKKSAFELKKLSAVTTGGAHISEYQFKGALWLANTYVAPLGLAMKAMLPPFFGKKKYPMSAVPALPEPRRTPKFLTIVARSKDMLNLLKPQIDDADGQVLIIVPELTFIPNFKKFHPAAAVIHSQSANAEWYALWKRAKEDSNLTVIGTRQALILPFSNLKLIVIIDPLHEFYKSDFSPKYRTLDFARYTAGLHGARLIAASVLLGTEAYARLDREGLIPEVKDRMAAWPFAIEQIDLVEQMKNGNRGACMPPAKRAADAAVRAGKRVLILSSRRGYSGILVCQNCGWTQGCPTCGTPMRVHQAFELVLACHRCNTTLPYPRTCPQCHGSHVHGIGPAGSQKLFEEIRRAMDFGQIDRAPVLVIDADITKNQTEEDEIMATVRKNKASILIATQKIFSYIFDDSFDLIMIPSFDALISSADFQTTERLWYQLEKLADFKPEKLVIQSYNSHPELEKIKAHEYDDLYDEELKLRRALHYPPYSRIVRLTFSHHLASRAARAGRTLVEKLKMTLVHLGYREFVEIADASPLFVRKDQARYTYTVILKIKPEIPSMRSFLRFVPAGWLIDADPREVV